MHISRGSLLGALLAAFSSVAVADITDRAATQVADDRPGWLPAIRAMPFWESQGVYRNLATIRRWVLTSSSFCERPDRHILFDRRGRFVAYVADGKSRDATQEKLNTRRKKFADESDGGFWTPGDRTSTGYPFALSCKQPFANLEESLDRYSGAQPDDRLWGTWDGMVIGAVDQPISLHEALQMVFSDRVQRGRIHLHDDVLNTLAGTVLIESGGRARAASSAGAIGIMQLQPSALSDCEIDEQFHFHRLAQIDCALRLLEQNERNIRAPFNTVFQALPDAKRGRLFRLLLIQAYHGGVGRIADLLTDDDLSRPAKYFAAHQERFSANDMALGMIFHNLGRRELGLQSLFYVVDVAIASSVVCSRYPDMQGCEGD